MFGLLAQHGANYLANATIFPHNIASGATFNPELVELSGRITGKDLRSCGLAWAISPAIDLAIEPRWARNYECHSSDPYVSAVMADAIVRGIQAPFESLNISRAQAGAVVKHFLGYSNPDNGEDRQDATNPDWVIERFHLPPFRSAFAAGALGVMFNSGTVNKIPGHSNQALTVRLLRETLNFTGVAISDYADVTKLMSVHKKAPSFRDAVRLAIEAGLDVSMIPESWAEATLSLVSSGQISAARIAQSARRILDLKLKLGLFELPFALESMEDSVGTPADRAAALQMAEEAITMLKNTNHTLPIPLTPGANRSILVTGPCGDSIRLQCGGWTILWAGANSDAEFYGHGSTFFQGIYRLAFPSGWKITYIEGVKHDVPSTTQEALDAAKEADYTVVCLGEKRYVEFTNDIQDLYARCFVRLFPSVSNSFRAALSLDIKLNSH